MENGFERVSTTPDRLREAMKIKGKKQVDLVRATGIDKGSISSYLSGRYEPKQEAIYKMAIMFQWNAPKHKKITMPFLTSFCNCVKMKIFFLLC